MTEFLVPQFNGKAHNKFQALAKPIGALCNIDCTYCYYLDKQQLLDYSSQPESVMSHERLETYIRQYIEGQNTAEIVFSWHGGEPTLLGVEYFEKVVELQKRFCPPHSSISNDLQTNATLLTSRWCAFFKRHNFIIGVSIDGPESLHNHYRTNKAGRGTFDKTMRGIRLLQEHQVNFATLTCINNLTGSQPLEVYRFLRDEVRSPQMQFIPVVDKVSAPTNNQWLKWDSMNIIPVKTAVEPWSISADQWGAFLITIFDEWFHNDFGKVMIPYFENFVGVWMGKSSTMCTLSEICGKGLAIEPNGEVYSCDHYVYPEFSIGNIHQTELKKLAFSSKQQQFGFAKRKSLPNQCKQCPYLFACHGECPKNRIAYTKQGQPGLNYLCDGWIVFFKHIDPVLSLLLVNNGYPLLKRD
ncbi:anaerobic sulfatase maturase [Vibrio sp. 10N.261.51.F12]|uniref:anaerobic sulfatase maturase n=1 Tax=Vibrio sp. 10N.261.51.F12 TaxID=3229679 RepID=UPI003553E024